MARERLSPFAEWVQNTIETYGESVMLKWLDECQKYDRDPVEVWMRTMHYFAMNPMDEETLKAVRQYAADYYGYTIDSDGESNG